MHGTVVRVHDAVLPLLCCQVEALTGERAEQEAGAEALRRQLAELRQQLAEVKVSNRCVMACGTWP